MSLPPPSAEFQVRFLRDLQRILEEGQFTATYKFALVHALADLAVQRGDDSGDALALPVRAIAERFVELYWRQVAPWPGAGEALVLAQNTGRQAEIVRRVREARASYGERVDELRHAADNWKELTAEVDRVVRVMPLWRLQVVGKDTYPFLYPHELSGRGASATITLNPGIAFCFRTFHPLVLDLVQSAWVRFIRRLNRKVLGETKELSEFLFGAPRASLTLLHAPLREVQKELCFYCGTRLGAGAHVDHFIPWSRYQVDLGHNFVLAHDRCNGAKADHLAAETHLKAWVKRNQTYAYDLRSLFDSTGFSHDMGASNGVARWAYRQVSERRGLVWLQGRSFKTLDPNWKEILG
jgi:hypothetical protein